MPAARVFTASFHRPNLNLAVQPKSSETAQLLALLKRHANEAGIVYCGSRAKTERIAAMLKSRDIEAVTFHAGLPSGQKREAAGPVRAGAPGAVVATSAFV